MKQKLDRPTILVSRCLDFEACRYDGQMIPDSFVKILKEHVHFLTVCPEMEIGLGVPRDTIRIEKHDDSLQLIQPKTGKNLTKEMTDYSVNRLKSIHNIQGIILKSKSPSCGLKGISIYKNSARIQEKTVGFFAKEVQEKYANLALEDEGRLNNARIREHFLTKLYTIWEFRKLSLEANMKTLVEFQASNKYLFMSYNQRLTTELGRIVANHEKLPIAEVYDLYEVKLYEILKKSPARSKVINALQHILGYFSKELNADEKKHFLDMLDDYRAEKISLSTCNILLRSWILRFNQSYLKKQRFFSPFPDELMKGSQLERKLL